MKLWQERELYLSRYNLRPEFSAVLGFTLCGDLSLVRIHVFCNSTVGQLC